MNKNKFKEIFGFEYGGNKIWEFKGLTRNNPMFTHLGDWQAKGISSFVLEKNIVVNKDKYRFIFYDNNNNIIEGIASWTTVKSIGTRLFDIMLMDESYYDTLIKFKTSNDQKVADYFLGKRVYLEKSYIMFNMIDKNRYDPILEYWRKLAKVETSYYSMWVAKRINTFFYKELIQYDESKSNKMIDLEIRSNYQRLEYLRRIVRSQFLKIMELDIKEETVVDDEIVFDDKGKYNEISIKQLISLAKTGQIQIPTFQRDYVWKPNQIISLLQSMAENYPIGAPLWYKCNNDKFNFQSKNPIIDLIQNQSFEKIQAQYLVLDGQQRITSILSVFLYNYINHLSLSKGNDEHIDILSQKRIDEIYFYKDKFWDKKKLIEKYGKRFNYAEYSISRERISNEIYKKFQNFKIPIIYIYDLDLKKLIEVFRRINMGSTKLTNFDLLHSFFTAQGHDLSKEVKSIQQKPLIKRFSPSKDIIVQSLKVVYDNEYYAHGYNIKLSSIFLLSEHQHTAQNFMNSIKKTKDVIERVIKVLKEEYGFHYFKDLPNNAFFIGLFAILLDHYDKPSKIDSWSYDHLKPHIKEVMSRILVRSINGDYSSATSNKINVDLKEIFREETITIPHLRANLNNELNDATYKNKNALYKACIHSVLTLQQPKSLVNGEKFVKLDDRETSKADSNQHHFIPKKCSDIMKLLTSIELENIDHIKNIFLISSTENKFEIKNKSPNEYLLAHANIKNEWLVRDLAKSHLLKFEDLENYIKTKENKYLKDMLDNRYKSLKKELKQKFILKDPEVE